jgi:hypothetical protein
VDIEEEEDSSVLQGGIAEKDYYRYSSLLLLLRHLIRRHMPTTATKLVRGAACVHVCMCAACWPLYSKAVAYMLSASVDNAVVLRVDSRIAFPRAC